MVHAGEAQVGKRQAGEPRLGLRDRGLAQGNRIQKLAQGLSVHAGTLTEASLRDNKAA